MSGLRLTGTRSDPRLPAKNWANKEIYYTLFLFNLSSSFLKLKHDFWGFPLVKPPFLRSYGPVILHIVLYLKIFHLSGNITRLPVLQVTSQINEFPTCKRKIKMIFLLEFDDLFAMTCP